MGYYKAQYDYEPCPHCGAWLSKKDKECECGWKRPKHLLIDRTGRCAYVAPNGQRCPLPGAMALNIRGQTEKWYCQYHCDATRDKTKSREIILEEILTRYHYLMEERIPYTIQRLVEICPQVKEDEDIKRYFEWEKT